MENRYDYLGGQMTDQDKLIRMKDHLLRSGTPEGWFDRMVETISESSKSGNKDLICLAIRLMYDLEWKEVERIWTLPGLTPEVWDNYENFGVEGLQEQELLESALDSLRKRFAIIHRM